MKFSIVLCVVLCVVTGASSASVRLPRQLWGNPFERQHFHFPNDQFPSDDSNEVIDFPNRPPGPPFQNGFRPGFRPKPNRPQQGNNWPESGESNWSQSGESNWSQQSNNNWSQQGNNKPQQGSTNRPQQSNSRPQMTTSTTTERSSTPRTFHLAPEGCNCPFTPQFNPVCGSDGNTYKNSGLLNCFRRCGIDVTQRRMGSC